MKSRWSDAEAKAAVTGHSVVLPSRSVVVLVRAADPGKGPDEVPPPGEPQGVPPSAPPERDPPPIEAPPANPPTEVPAPNPPVEVPPGGTQG